MSVVHVVLKQLPAWVWIQVEGLVQ